MAQENNKPKELSIGGIWKDEDRSGRPYYSGKIRIDDKEVRFVAFENTFKQEGEQTPDFRIYLKRSREEGQESQPVKATAKSVRRAPARRAPATESSDASLEE